MTWQTQTLGEICDEGGGEVRTGPFGSQLHESDYSEMGTPVVMPKDIIEGRVSERTVARIADEHVNRLAQHQLRTGDIVYGRRGDIGRQALITPRESGWLCGTGCLRITPGESRVDSTYLHYYLRDAKVIEGIAQQAIGATMPNLNTTILRGIQVRFPPASEQKRIASILSAYDDLIENNTRRIAILEEMARRIYEEWFVRFRFPGHEGVRMVESELGLVPEGWRAAVLGDVAAYINRGLAPKYDDSAACIVINQKCIRDQRLSLAEARKQGKPVPAEKVVRLGDVLINSTGVGTLGRVAQVLEAFDNCTVDTHVSIVRPGTSCDPDYFGLAVLAQQAHFEAQGVGSTGQTELSRGRIAETPVVVPPLAVQRAFAKLVRPMRLLTLTLHNKNLNLRTTRDLLLPKLISGELNVSAVPEPEALAA